MVAHFRLELGRDLMALGKKSEADEHLNFALREYRALTMQYWVEMAKRPHLGERSPLR